MTFYADNRNSALSGGERKASIGSPACSPSVICVGATAWRNHSTNFEGTPLYYDCGMGGVVASYSSTGPTRDALVKPDVMAPGTFVISSASSFYAEENIETAKKTLLHSRNSTEGNIHGHHLWAHLCQRLSWLE